MKKIMILFIGMFLLCGCTNQKCIESHQEKRRCVWYSTIIVGKATILIPHYYSCTKTICDKYEEVSK